MVPLSMLRVSKRSEISCHLADNRENLMCQMDCISARAWIMAEVSPIHSFMSQQHERMHPSITIAFVASYLLLARSMVMQIFSKAMFL